MRARVSRASAAAVATMLATMACEPTNAVEPGMPIQAATTGAAQPDARAPRVWTMSEIEASVLDGNHDLRLARIAVEAARAGVQQADTRPNATLSWNGASYSPGNGLGSGGLASKRVDQILRVDQTFERGGKRRLRVEIAETQLLGRTVDVEEQRRETLQAARDAYVDLLLAEQRLLVLEQTQRTYQSSLDAATKRVKAGDLAAADLARLRVDVLKAATDEDAARADGVRARVALATLLDAGPDTGSMATDGRWPTFVATDAEPSDPYAVDRRPDVVSARFAAEAAATSVDLARSQRIRDITVGVQIERYPGYGGTGNTIGAGISIPLLTGDDYRGDIAHAQSDREAAEETTAKVRAAAVADGLQARADLEAARRKVATYRGGLVDAASHAAAAADFAFERGALGVMDVLDARRTLLATRLEALEAEADYARAQAAVAAAGVQTAIGARR